MSVHTSELLQDTEFMEAQYGHLPKDEQPTEGPIIDITHALKANFRKVTEIDQIIRAKRIRSTKWVEENFPGQTALFLTRPYEWRRFPQAVQDKGADWLGNIILDVYGPGYPLPNKASEFNLRGILDGSLLPYLGLIAPNELGNGTIYKNPEKILEAEMMPIASSAFVLDEHGSAELGRTARRTCFEGFDGGALVLERMLDWWKNRHRLLEGAPLLTSVVRAAEAHNHSPSSGPVQNLTIGKLGMRITLTAPTYDVNGLEPFLHVYKSRDEQAERLDNITRTIVTIPGPHIEYFKELWQHQLGLEPDIAAIDPTRFTPYRAGKPSNHGEYIYGSFEVTDSGNDSLESAGFDKALPELEAQTPLVMVKMEAETPESAATQQALVERGYVICGIEPAHDYNFINTRDNNGFTAEHYSSPIIIYMAKLGERAKDGRTRLAKPYFPTPEDSSGLDIHGSKLRPMLYSVHDRIRESLS